MKTCEDCNKITSGFCDKHLPTGFCPARQTSHADDKEMLCIKRKKEDG